MKRYLFLIAILLCISLALFLGFRTSSITLTQTDIPNAPIYDQQPILLTTSLQDARLVTHGNDRLAIVTIKLTADARCHYRQFQSQCTFNSDNFKLKTQEGSTISVGPAPTFYIPEFRMAAMPVQYTLPAKTSMTGQLYFYLISDEQEYTLSFANNFHKQTLPIHL